MEFYCIHTLAEKIRLDWDNKILVVSNMSLTLGRSAILSVSFTQPFFISTVNMSCCWTFNKQGFLQLIILIMKSSEIKIVIIQTQYDHFRYVHIGPDKLRLCVFYANTIANTQTNWFKCVQFTQIFSRICNKPDFAWVYFVYFQQSPHCNRPMLSKRLFRNSACTCTCKHLMVVLDR